MKTGRKSTLKLFLLAFILAFSCLGIKQNVQAASKYTIYVNRTQNIVNVVESQTGNLVRAMWCSTGINYRTITGTYYTNEKLRWHALYGGVYGQYCTRIHGAYLFHSVPYYKTKCNQVETKEYNKLGKQASKGCIRLAVVDCKWIYDNCPAGTKVVIGESKTLQKPNRVLIKISTKKKAGWDPTDPSKKNPYAPVLKLKKSSLKKVKLGSKFNPLSVLKVSSKLSAPATLLKNIKVTGSVNTSKIGSYKVTYTLTEPKSLYKKSLTVNFKVIN